MVPAVVRLGSDGPAQRPVITDEIARGNPDVLADLLRREIKYALQVQFVAVKDPWQQTIDADKRA